MRRRRRVRQASAQRSSRMGQLFHLVKAISSPTSTLWQQLGGGAGEAQRSRIRQSGLGHIAAQAGAIPFTDRPKLQRSFGTGPLALPCHGPVCPAHLIRPLPAAWINKDARPPPARLPLGTVDLGQTRQPSSIRLSSCCVHSNQALAHVQPIPQLIASSSVPPRPLCATRPTLDKLFC